jgi:hypothetical protein
MSKNKKQTKKTPHHAKPTHWLKRIQRLSTPWWAASVVVLVGTVLTWVFMADATHSVSTSLVVRQDEPEASVSVPSYVYRRLDGMVVDPGLENKWPIGVMIENLPVVRPQAGLGSAKVVFETLAEGGATRFLAFYDGTENLAKLGPVRSARPYYVNWATEYDAAYVHAGGSPQALIEIEARKLLGLNGIAGAAKYFWREKGIAAPHNLFTSTEKINAAIAASHLATQTPNYESWVYKDDAREAERGTPTKRITVAFSGRAYEAGWEYHADTNDYFRFNGGVPHRDSLTNDIIKAKNVVVEFLPQEKVQAEKGRLSLTTTGTGRVLVFRDGQVTEGTWEKKTIWRRTSYFDANGQPIALNRGATWVEVVPGQRSVTY